MVTDSIPIEFLYVTPNVVLYGAKLVAVIGVIVFDVAGLPFVIPLPLYTLVMMPVVIRCL